MYFPMDFLKADYTVERATKRFTDALNHHNEILLSAGIQLVEGSITVKETPLLIEVVFSQDEKYDKSEKATHLWREFVGQLYEDYKIKNAV